MAEDASERVRREFLGKAPELRRALVAELSALLDRCATLSPDENFVLRHVLAYAGYSQDGLFVPVFAALWGEEQSYFPAVRLPEPRVRAAAGTLRRRGVLKPGAADGIFVSPDVLRALSAAPSSAGAPVAALAPASVPAAARRVIVSAAMSLDGFVAPFQAAPEGDFEPVAGPVSKIARLRAKPGKNILAEPTPAVLQMLLKRDLVDALVLSVLPVLLGRGTPLFKRGRPELRLKLTDTRTFPTGLVQLRYDRV